MSKKSTPLAILLSLFVCLVSMVSVSAQSQATTGNIEGRVLDPNGAVVPGAQVTAKNESTGLEKSATSDGGGNYRIILLPPGSYLVTVKATGFASAPLKATV